MRQITNKEFREIAKAGGIPVTDGFEVSERHTHNNKYYGYTLFNVELYTGKDYISFICNDNFNQLAAIKKMAELGIIEL